jgi:large subunit ribosomal protein L3
MTEVLGKKIGMTQIYNQNGLVEPITVVQAGPCVVVKLKTKEKDGYQAVQVGFGKVKHPNKAEQGYFKKQGINEIYKYLREFKKASLEGITVGQVLKLDTSFKLNEIVNVRGTSIGKGFQGPVKRFHFNRHPMSHGSKSHRMPGSSGSGTFVSHVWPGKRRAGHMGSDTVTTKGLVILYMDPEKNILGIRGSVPGPKGSIVEIMGTGKIAATRVKRIAHARLEKAAKTAGSTTAKK